MKNFARGLALVGFAVGGTMHAQPPRRLPVIAGNDTVHVLVEVDGTVKTWGDPLRM